MSTTTTSPVGSSVAVAATPKAASLAPINKVSAATAASALVFVVVFLLNRYLQAGIDGGVENAMAVLATFAAGWFTPPDAGGRTA